MQKNSSTLKILFLLIHGLIFLNCYGSKSQKIPGKSYFDGNTFHNLDSNIKAPGFLELLKWQTTRLFSPLPSLNPNDYTITTVRNDGSAVRENTGRFSATWIGHATVLLQMDGKNILTDPIWSERCSPVSFAGPKRYTNPGISLEELPRIDLVVISHNHYDHMDIPTLVSLNQKFKPLFVVGLKNKAFLINAGLERVVEMDWWETQKLDSLEITFTPTQHTSARGLFDRDRTLWGSYILRGKENTVYFAGDTGYFPEFKMIGDKYPGIDYAILPIGAYEPRWFMKPVHMNPEDSIQAFQDLGAKFFIPIHYHTFVLTDEGIDEPIQKIKNLFLGVSIPNKYLLLLKIGESHFVSKKKE